MMDHVCKKQYGKNPIRWRNLSLAIISFIFLFSFIPVVEAHSSLLESVPGKGQLVDTSPSSLKLQFNEPIDHDLATVTIYDWDGRPILTKNPEGQKERSKALQIPLPELDQGTYTVQWNVVSLDGHPVDGSYHFAVGKATEGGTASVGTNDNATTILIIARAIVEGFILLIAGLYWFAWSAEKRNFPSLGTLLARGRFITGSILIVGTIGEFIAYASTLPPGLLPTILNGRWDLLLHFPFVLMLFAQLLFLILLFIPGMVRAWYLIMWLILAAIPSFGGHVWGMQHPFIALIPRILHQFAIALWLGALGYFILFLLFRKKQANDDSLPPFRSFFVPKVMIASGLVVATGVIMVFLQSSWTAVVNQWDSWSTLLLVKILLTVLMLGIALFQTLKWRKRKSFSTPRLIRVEWIIGLIIIVFGVWMSQSAYPIPIKSYTATLSSEQGETEINIANLRRGEQEMNIQLPLIDGKEPEHIAVDMAMPDHGMSSGPFEAKQVKQESYQVTLPFTMIGSWKLVIHATYPNGVKSEWEDSLFISGGGND